MGFNFHSFNSRTEWGIKKHTRRGREGEGKGEEGSVWPRWRARHWIRSAQHRERVGREKPFEGTSLTPFKLSVSNRACFSC